MNLWVSVALFIKSSTILDLEDVLLFRDPSKMKDLFNFCKPDLTGVNLESLSFIQLLLG